MRRHFMKKQVPIRLRSGQAFDSAEVRFAQDDGINGDKRTKRTETEYQALMRAGLGRAWLVRTLSTVAGAGADSAGT
jgi:hypothetical protein